jgi:uncharacterized protein YjbI with pentapeptide repeats
VHAAPPPQANPHTAAPILCGGCVFHEVNGDLGDRLAGKDLRNAILPDSNLLRANLTGTDFSGADLYGITWGGTVLTDLRCRCSIVP